MAEEVDPSGKHQWRDSIYNELRQIASTALATETPGHSLQPTLLANDAYIRLVDQRNVHPSDRAPFMAAAANIIRRLLVDYARKRNAQKRGGLLEKKIPLHISVADDASSLDVLELHDALKALARQNPRAAEVVELKFFGGLTSLEAAGQLKVSLGTVNNDWQFAKAWLYRTLADEPETESVDDE